MPALCLPRPREIASSRTPRAGPRRAPGCAVCRMYYMFVRAVESSRHWIEGGVRGASGVRACLLIYTPGTRLEVRARRPAFAFDIAALAIASQARVRARARGAQANWGWLAGPTGLAARAVAFHLRISLSGAAY